MQLKVVSYKELAARGAPSRTPHSGDIFLVVFALEATAGQEKPVSEHSDANH